MDFRHFRYFLVVAEELHVARAAEKLGIAQPALSQMIRTIEERVGARLFHRAHRRIELTAAGRAFVVEVRQALAHVDAASLVAKRAARGETGRVRIGYVSSALAEEAFLTALAAFRRSHPEVVVDLLLRTTADHIAAMRDGDQDLAMARGPAPGVPEDCEARLFSHWPLMVALPSRHPLCRQRQVGLEDLRDETLLLPDDAPGTGLTQTISQMFAATGFLPRRSITVSEMTSWIGLVGGGLGVALLPSSARSLQMSSVTYRPLKGGGVTSDLLLISRRGEQAPAVHALLERLWRAAPAKPKPAPDGG
jgi:DNA-binding transcriptional LysR family regulator